MVLFTVYIDDSFMALDDAIYRSEPHTGASFHFLGSKERIKNTCFSLIVHSNSRVGHRYLYISSGFCRKGIGIALI